MERRRDRISSLPDNVREKILMLLPLRDAAKSCVMSTEWRNMWSNLPSLVIDESFGEDVAHRFPGERKVIVDELIMLDLCKVLILRRGLLQEFSLSMDRMVCKAEQILRLLPHRTIESLTLTIKTGSLCWLSKPVLLSFSQLKTLRLSGCRLTFAPDSLEGLNRLTVLELKVVVFPRNLPQLRFRYPLLTTLTFDRCLSAAGTHVTVLEEAPRLRRFHFVGCSHSLEFKNTPLLKDVHIAFGKMESWVKFKSNLLKVNGGLAGVESLSVARGFYEYLATEEPRNLEGNQKPWEKLSYMRLDDVFLNRKNHAWSVLRMITSSPNLRQLALIIMVDDTVGTPHGEHEGKDSNDDEALGMMKSGLAVASVPCRMLWKVEVKGVKGTEDEMTLIRWLLNSTPALDTMEIELSTELSDAGKLSVVIELNRIQRASTRAQIIIN